MSMAAPGASATDGLDIRPLTPDLLGALGAVLRGGWGAGCWCLYPRMTDRAMRDLPGEGSRADRRRTAMAALAARPVAPGLLGFLGSEPVGWVAVAPRAELARVAASRATPPIDNRPVWVIPCVTVRRGARGRGFAVALIRAAAACARAHGGTVVEAYPRAGDTRADDGSVYFGTEPMFRRAGFSVARPPVPGLPARWTPRLTMRCCAAE
jgi:GNAT superfamily N-acetyltransferase